MSQIHLAIAADFTLAEKLLEALENSNLTFDKVSAVEIEPFGEEQNLRFGTKAVEQFELDNLDWSQFYPCVICRTNGSSRNLSKSRSSGLYYSRSVWHYLADW